MHFSLDSKSVSRFGEGGTEYICQEMRLMIYTCCNIHRYSVLVNKAGLPQPG